MKYELNFHFNRTFCSVHVQYGLTFHEVLMDYIVERLRFDIAVLGTHDIWTISIDSFSYQTYYDKGSPFPFEVRTCLESVGDEAIAMQLGSLRPNLLHSTHFYNLHLNVTNTVTISPSSDSLKIQCMPKLHGLQTVQTHILYLLNKRGYIEEPVTFTSNTTRLIRNRSLSFFTTKVVSVGSESQTQAPWIPKRLHKSYWN